MNKLEEDARVEGLDFAITYSDGMDLGCSLTVHIVAAHHIFTLSLLRQIRGNRVLKDGNIVLRKAKRMLINTALSSAYTCNPDPLSDILGCYPVCCELILALHGDFSAHTDEVSVGQCFDVGGARG